MIPNMPALGIRFDIGKIESGMYGTECWKILWRAVEPPKLGGASLFEGDTEATLKGEEGVFLIAIHSTRTSLFDEVRAALEQSPEFDEVAASPRFVEDDGVVSEPLVGAGQIDSEGNLVGKAYNARAALGEVLRDQRHTAQADLPSADVPARDIPASSRTADLPSLSSLKELLDFLLTNFGEQNKYQFWLSPEELCDIVERYPDMLRIQWEEDSSGLSHDMTYVTLFGRDDEGGNISLYGLFPFASEQAAKEYCNDPSENFDYLFGQLEGLYGVRGKFATNFTGKSHSNAASYQEGKGVDPSDLWPRICRRREVLGIDASP